MGRRSSKNESEKSVYQKAREALDLTRDQASDLMVSVSPAQIEKIESGKQLPQAYDILQMAAAYKRPELCNYFCTHECEIGKKSVPEIQLNELPSIILETIASLNDTMPLTNRLIEITRDGKISNNEIPDFVKIKNPGSNGQPSPTSVPTATNGKEIISCSHVKTFFIHS